MFMKYIAHKGLSAYYPENTLLAFDKALQAGADGIETDLRLSADEKIVLFHDKSLKRITGHSDAPESLTLSALKKLDAGSGESIPTLDELLHLTQGKATLILEIKYNTSTYKRLCELTKEKIKDKLSWVEVSCFHDKVLEYMHILNADIGLHKLIEKASVLTMKDFENVYSYVSYFDVAVALHHIVLAQGLIQKYKIIFWTVDKEDLSKEIDAGLYGVMKNNIGHLQCH